MKFIKGSSPQAVVVVALVTVLVLVVATWWRQTEPYKYGGNPPPGWGNAGKTKVTDYHVGIYYAWGGGGSYKPRWVSTPRKYPIKDSEATQWLSGFNNQLQQSVNNHGAKVVAQRIIEGWGYELAVFSQLNALRKHLNLNTNMTQSYYDVHKAMRDRGYGVAIERKATYSAPK